MLSLIRCSVCKKGRKGRLGQIEASPRKAVNKEAGPFAINVSQVIQLSRRSVLTFNFPTQAGILGCVVLYLCSDCGNIELVARLL